LWDFTRLILGVVSEALIVLLIRRRDNELIKNTADWLLFVPCWPRRKPARGAQHHPMAAQLVRAFLSSPIYPRSA